MTPRKRKADSASPAESLHHSPHKRARSETTNDTADKRSGNAYSSDVSPNGYTEPSIHVAKPSNNSHTAPVQENEATTLSDLPQTWDQASAADKMLVRLKEISKAPWATVESAWEKSTGEKAAKDVLLDRYRLLRDIKADSDGVLPRRVLPKRVPPRRVPPRRLPPRRVPPRRVLQRCVLRRDAEPSYVEDPLEVSEEVSSPPTTEDRSPSPVNRGPSDKSPYAISKVSKNAAISSNTASAAPTESFAPDQDLPQSWEQADASDQLLVRSKINKVTWSKITEAWKKLTGETPADGALKDRYERIKRFVIRPDSDRGRRPAESRAPDQVVSRRAKPRQRKPGIPRLSETPMKQNMDRGKRKTSVKYTDSTTDDDELFAAPTEPVVTTSAKRNAGRAAKVNRSDPEWLVTSEKSPLADEDLHAEFSDPKTYEDFMKSDWESLRETLAPNVPVNPDGYSIPMTFFKYDPDFRRGIREFQEDLAAGRLDPKWQADAAQAMEERARGEFDAYKEDQFEAFWGQKQKLNYDALAGESSKIKLEMLIKNNIFKVGDYFSYSRVIGGKKGMLRVLIEKDCKIVKVDSKELTFAIPPGQRKYSRHMFEFRSPGDTKSEGKATMDGGDEESPTALDSRINGTKANVDTASYGDEGLQPSKKGDGALITKKMAGNGSLLDIESKTAEALPDARAEKDGTGEITQLNGNEVEANIKPQDHETHEATTSEGPKENGALVQSNGDNRSSANDSEDEDIPCTISVLVQLENKILDVHGSFKSEETVIHNAWKDFRGIRNHQDLGSLFEMREEFYVHKYPQIMKAAKRKR